MDWTRLIIAGVAGGLGGYLGTKLKWRVLMPPKPIHRFFLFIAIFFSLAIVNILFALLLQNFFTNGERVAEIFSTISIPIVATSFAIGIIPKPTPEETIEDEQERRD